MDRVAGRLELQVALQQLAGGLLAPAPQGGEGAALPDGAGLPCDSGFCHLSGPRISDSDAYGAGLVNVATP